MSAPSRTAFALAALRRPLLVPEAIAAAWSARPRTGPGRWVPVPESGYWSWRLHTAYGATDPDPHDVPAVLAWRRRMRRMRR